MKILIGELSQESNTFNPIRTTMASARRWHFNLGEEMFNSPNSTIKGFLSVAKQDAAQCIPTLFIKLKIAGVFASKDFEELKELVRDQIKRAVSIAGKCDAFLFRCMGPWWRNPVTTWKEKSPN